jgi:hypothetical protein
MYIHILLNIHIDIFVNVHTESEGSKKRKMMTGKGQQDSEEAAFGEYVSQGGTQATYRVRIPGPHGTYKMVSTFYMMMMFT